jgi:hypothetical protein
MTDARTGPMPNSHLREGSEKLSLDAEAGPLGDGYQRKNRGRFQLISAGGGFVRLLDIVGSDQLAQQMTVSASVKLAAAHAVGESGSVPACILRVSWGTDGASHDAEVDLVEGVCFALPASALRVGVQIDPAEVDPPDVHVAVSVGYYPTRGRVTRTVPGVFTSADPLAVGGLVSIPIPAFARRLEVLRVTAGASAQVEVNFESRLGAVLGGTNTVGPIDLPIPNGATSVRLQNTSGVAAMTWQAIFGLGF